MPAHLSATFSSACSVKTGRKTSPLIRALAPLRCIHARYRHSRTDKLFSLNHLKIGGKQDGKSEEKRRGRGSGDRKGKEKVTAVKELANRNAAEAEAKFADELKQKDTQMAKLTAEKAKVAAQIEVLEKRAAEAEKSNQKRQKEAIGIALEEERKKLDAAAEKQSELLKQIDELNGQRDRQVAEARRKAEEEMNAKFAKERAELEEKERAAKAVADVARKQIDAAKRQVTEAIENRELTGAIARAKFAIESALDAYSRAADTVIEVGRLDKVEASKLLDDMAESSQSIVAKFVKTLKSE